MSPQDAATRYAAEVRRIYAEAEVKLLETIRRRLEQGKSMDVATWEASRNGDSGLLLTEARKIVKELKGNDPAVSSAVTAAYKSGVAAASESLLLAHIASIASPASYKTGHAIEQLTKLALDSTHATHLKMLRTTTDIYRSVIAETAEVVKAGGMSLTDAMQAALNKFADKGVTGFVDKAGRNWGLQEYVEMAMRTTCGQASVEGHIDQLQANGHDLVIVSSHGDCCEACFRWEGEILSMSGQDDRYPSVDDAIADGLWHPNCSHTTSVWIEGVTTKDKAPYDKARYDDEQQQRGIERGIRQWKKREAVAITDDAKAEAKSKIGEWQAKQRELIANSPNDLRRDYPREQIRSGK